MSELHYRGVSTKVIEAVREFFSLDDRPLFISESRHEMSGSYRVRLTVIIEEHDEPTIVEDRP